MELKELKAMWLADIAKYQTEIDNLKAEKEQDAISLKSFEEKMTAYESEIAKLKEGMTAIDKALADKKLPKEAEDELKGGFKNLNDFIYSLGKMVIDGEMDPRLKEYREKTVGIGSSALSGSEGGFLVPEFFSNQLLGDMNVYGKILSRCFQLPVSGQIVRIPAIVDYDHSSQTYYGGVAVTRGKEKNEIIGTAPDFGQVKLELKKLVGLTAPTNEILKWSAISLEPILRRMFASAMSAVLERELIKGTGNGQMLGLINAPCKYEVAIESGQTTTNPFLPENITHMFELIPEGSVAPVWLIHPKDITYLMLLNKEIGLGGAFTPFFDLSAMTMLGLPVIKSEFCYAPNTTGDLFLVDLAQYIYAYDSAGEQFAISPDVYFVYDQTGIRLVMYNDGQPWWKSSKLLDDGSTYVSPVLTLGTRS